MDSMGILPVFNGIAVHDHMKPYFKYSCKHSVCNAHILRELKFFSEQHKQNWSIQISSLLSGGELVLLELLTDLSINLPK